jgi:SecD/SecF fusion protein
MKKFGRPFTLVAVVVLLGLAACWPPKDKIKLGIDLSGGTILVYETKKEDKDNLRIDDLIAALKKRINPEGTKDIVIRNVGNTRVEIILPKASPEEVDEIKRRMTAVGAMQFRILADRRDLSDQQPIERALAQGSLANPPSRYKWAKLAETVKRKKSDAGEGGWVTIDGNRIIDPTRAWERDHFVGGQMTLVSDGAQGQRKSLTFPIIANDSTSVTLDPTRAETPAMLRKGTSQKVPSVAAEFKGIDSYQILLNPSRIYDDPNLSILALDRGEGAEERFVLCKIDSQNVTGDMLESVHPAEDERVQPAVGFKFKPLGASKFGRLTREYSPGRREGDFKYHLAILLDDLVMSAPVINQEIRDSGIIENMPLKQRDELIDILRAGRLPSSIDPNPLQQESIGPTLGKDTIDKGLRAIFISMLIVPVFMVFYYRQAGVIAVIALFINMILLVGSMAFTDSSFTLPGLAGLALTIGMAVDANVLIFERMREEAERGANLGTQIRNGFNRAWSTILDSNVTTMLSGLVLWSIGTEEIKGFALTLILGLLWNLFTAVYVSRLMFEFLYQKGWLKKLSMASGLPKTNINFVGPRRILMAISVVAITIGLVVFARQGQTNFNIDFTGGSLVTLQLDNDNPEIRTLNDSQRVAYVRSQASQAKIPDTNPPESLPNIAIESLTVSGENNLTRFNVRTTETNLNGVLTALINQFGSALKRLTAVVGQPVPISKPASPAVVDRFAGGVTIPLTFNREVDPDQLQISLANYLREQDINNPESRFELQRDRQYKPESGSGSRLFVRTNINPAEAEKLFEGFSKTLPADPSLTFQRRENFGAQVAKDTQLVALLAIVSSWAVIIAYLWFRFKSISFGFAAVVALVHDVLIALAAVAISPYKIDLPMVAAFLTIIGFSVNDTIVIFDRIREIKGKTPYLTDNIINAAVNQTLSRTLLTSLTALIVVLIMYLFGGEALQGFSFCLLVGFVSGIYSTIYIASPILIDWMGQKAPVGKAKAKSISTSK